MGSSVSSYHDHDTAEEIKQYIKFKIGKQSFGIDILKSREIVRTKKITEIPDSPSFIRGVIDLRDTVVPIIDLEKRFNMSFSGDGQKKGKVIIITVEKTLLGLKVSEVEEIVKIPAGDIKEAPEITRNYKQGYIEGVANLSGDLLVILAVQKIFSQKEIEEIKEI